MANVTGRGLIDDLDVALKAVDVARLALSEVEQRSASDKGRAAAQLEKVTAASNASVSEANQAFLRAREVATGLAEKLNEEVKSRTAGLIDDPSQRVRESG